MEEHGVTYRVLGSCLMFANLTRRQRKFAKRVWSLLLWRRKIKKNNQFSHINADQFVLSADYVSLLLFYNCCYVFHFCKQKIASIWQGGIEVQRKWHGNCLLGDFRGEHVRSEICYGTGWASDLNLNLQQYDKKMQVYKIAKFFKGTLQPGFTLGSTKQARTASLNGWTVLIWLT